MAYPDSIDYFSDTLPTQPRLGHSALHNQISEVVENLEEVVWTTDSEDPASIVFKLMEYESVDPGHRHTYVSIIGLGSSATVDIGTDPNNVVALDSDGKLPAVDASNLFNVPIDYTRGDVFAPSAGTVQNNEVVLFGADANHIKGAGVLWSTIAAALSIAHSHANYALLASLTSSGGGTKYLSDDGTYKTVNGAAVWWAITGSLSSQSDLVSALALKVDKVTWKGLSTNDFTNLLLSKLNGIEAWAQVNNISNVDAALLTGGGDTSLHTHDGRYYTESEITTLLSWKQNSLGYTAEDAANKSTSVATDGSSNTKYPSVKAVKDYADGLVAWLLDYRWAYNASSNVYPSAGGSGSAGSVMKGDMWVISVAGTLGWSAVQIGDSLIANTDSPGQTSWNWNVLNGNISYAPEDVTNKVTSISAGSTDVQYPSAKLLYDQLVGKQATLGFTPVTNARTLTINGTWYDLSSDRSWTISDANLSVTDVTTNNSSASAHGFLPKLENSGTKYLRDDGTWQTFLSGGYMLKIENLSGLNAGIARANIGLGSLATQSGTFSGTSSGTNTWDQTIANSSDATSHTVTLSASGWSVKLVEGANITLTSTWTAWDGIVTIASTASGSGDVTWPATNTDSYIPQWNGTNSKTLKNGLAVPSGWLAWLTEVGTKVTANGAITGATKTKITYDPKGLVTSGEDATTADIAASTNKNYVTDAQLTVIGNTTNTNSGDQFTSTTASKLLGRGSAGGTGPAQEITLGTNLSMTGTTLNVIDNGQEILTYSNITTSQSITSWYLYWVNNSVDITLTLVNWVYNGDTVIIKKLSNNSNNIFVNGLIDWGTNISLSQQTEAYELVWNWSQYLII